MPQDKFLICQSSTSAENPITWGTISIVTLDERKKWNTPQVDFGVGVFVSWLQISQGKLKLIHERALMLLGSFKTLVFLGTDSAKPAAAVFL